MTTPLLEHEVEGFGLPTTTLYYLLPPTVHHLHLSLAQMRGGGALLPITTHCSPPLPCSNARWGFVACYHPPFSTPPLLECEVEGFHCLPPPTLLYPSLACTVAHDMEGFLLANNSYFRGRCECFRQRILLSYLSYGHYNITA